MAQFNKYIFLPSFSLEPNKCTSYNSVFIRDPLTHKIRSIHERPQKRISKSESQQVSGNITRSNHHYNISDNAYRTLKRRINWLYYLAKSKRKLTYNGKEIYNFKIGFITLTLPSKQRTCTKDVTSNLLNQFLTEVREKTNLTNYVWRLEFQKNGNVHYHIVTDTYLDHFYIKSVWNRILKNHGYIEPFADKFRKLTLSDYNNLMNPDAKIPYADIVKRYAKGKRQDWQNPPTVDTKSVISNQAIANYISKYFAKESDENPIKNELDNDENSANLRLWFCSRSLSKLNTLSNFCEAVDYDIFSIISHGAKVVKKVYKYAVSFYFEVKNFSGTARRWIETLLKDYAKRQGYIPAI